MPRCSSTGVVHSSVYLMAARRKAKLALDEEAPGARGVVAKDGRGTTKGQIEDRRAQRLKSKYKRYNESARGKARWSKPVATDAAEEMKRAMQRKRQYMRYNSSAKGKARRLDPVDRCTRRSDRLKVLDLRDAATGVGKPVKGVAPPTLQVGR